MPSTYGIIRVSTELQARDGHSLPAATERLIEWGRSTEANWGQWRSDPQYPMGFAVDAGISAYTVDFADRPAVKQLLPRLKPGDRIVVHRIDRVWRKMRDFCRSVDWLQRNKIDLVVLDPPIDFSKATGRLLAHLLCAFAEFESGIKSERVKEAAAAKKARGEGPGRPKKGTTKAKPKLTWEDGDYKPISAEIRKFAPGGRVWIYLRCSHLDSVKSGLGLESQLAMAMRRAEQAMNDNPALAFGGVYCDQAVSAWKVPFRQRPQGKVLDDNLQEGDMIIFPKLDRGFRSTRDMLETVPGWLERGVSLKVVDVDLDFGVWTGMVVLEVLTLAAKIEAAITSARNKDIAKYLRDHGIFNLGRRVQQFLKVIRFKRGDKKVKRRVWDRKMLAEFRCLHWLMKNRKRFGLGSFLNTLQHFEDLLARRELRKPIPISGMSRPALMKRTGSQRDLIYPRWNKFKYEITAKEYEVIMAAYYASRKGRAAMAKVLNDAEGR